MFLPFRSEFKMGELDPRLNNNLVSIVKYSLQCGILQFIKYLQ